MKKVLDSYAILAYFEKETGHGIVENILWEAIQGKLELLMSVINWGEIYYIVTREYGSKKVQEIINLIDAFPIIIVDVNRSLTEQAALIKAANPLSYADAFAAALCRINEASLVTGDPEFKVLEKELKIEWLR